MQMQTDLEWMTQALTLAQQGLYTTTPNPRVGCVIVNDGVLVGQGAHLKAGEAHAEVHALKQAGERARGATAYVTLEPCSHVGRTPPCADALLATGIKRVVVAMPDPNPLVGGAGIARLRAHGLQVEVGVGADAALALNPGFIKRMTQQRPWVRLKLAASLDGQTALQNGASQWITGPQARRDVHHWRAQSCAIVTGIDTILLDDAALTVREVATARQPLRVVLDSQLRIPLHAKVLLGGHAWVVHACERPTPAQQAKLAALATLGVRTLCLANAQGQVDLLALLQSLAQSSCNEVLVEAGARLSGAFVAQGLVDACIFYFAPTLLGSGRGMLALPVYTQLSQALPLVIDEMRLCGADIRLLAHFANATLSGDGNASPSEPT